MNTVRNMWQRLESWLSGNAPEMMATLRPPAATAAIARAEELAGRSLPPDFRQSLALHDGQHPGAPALREPWMLLDLHEAATLMQTNRDLRADGTFAHSLDASVKADPGVHPVWWHDGWLPIATNGAGSDLVLDLAPAAGGVIGQIVVFHHDRGRRAVVASSFAEWLGQIVEAMEGNRVRVERAGPVVLSLRIEQ